MGTYTPNLRFYKPDPTEFVDVEAQLNRNWKIADKSVKRLLEYEFSTTQNPDVDGDPSMRSRFYKLYSNSVQTYFSAGPIWWQDPYAHVDTWISAKSYLQLGWLEHPDFPLVYRIVDSGIGTKQIEWAGAVITQYPNPVTIDVNTNMTVIDGAGVALPSTIRPTVSKYFTVNAGNTSSNYSIARLFFNSNGGVEIKRYGADPTNPGDENRIEFTGVKYNVEVTG